METACMVLFLLTAVVLMLLILVQKGRGGGLAGAFGGPGGHSAFGTKTADIFVKATAVIAGIFFLLSIVAAWIMRPEAPARPPERPGAPAPAEPGGATQTPPGEEAGGAKATTAKPAADAAENPAPEETTPAK